MSAGFKDYHPTVNVIFFISVIAFGMFILHPACLLASYLFAVAYFVKLKGKKSAVRLFLFVIAMMIFVTSVNTLFNHYGITILMQTKNGNNITLEALVNGFVTGLAVISVMVWFFCFNEVVTSDKIMSVFSFISPKIVLLLSMAMRFVPLYIKKYSEISQVQKTSGHYNNGFINKIKNAVSSVSILITWSVENAIETADSMKARGYSSKKRTSYSRFVFARRDFCLIVIVLFIDLVIAFAAFGGHLYVSYNPYVMINAPADFSVRYILTDINAVINPFTLLGTLAVILYFLLCALPIIIDIKEGLRWRRLQSKI